MKQRKLDEVLVLHSVSRVRCLKCCLSWALLVLLFAMALVPANGLTVFHAHDDHAESAEHDHADEISASCRLAHLPDAHPADDLHAHRIGWQQAQKTPGMREIGAPVLVAQVWLNVLGAVSPSHRSVDVPRASVEAKTVHAPPPLLRSMAFLI